MMKPFLLLLLLFLSICSNAVLVPVAPASSPFDPVKIKPPQIEKLTGKKLTTLQKIKLIIVQKVFRKYSSDEMTPKQKKLARLSMILGFAGLGLLLISLTPFLGILGLLAIPAAIFAVIFGAKSLKGNSNKEGIIGVVTGGLTITFIVLALILVALTFSA